MTKPLPSMEYNRLITAALTFAQTNPSKAREALVSARRLIADHLDDADWRAADAELGAAIEQLDEESQGRKP